MNAWTSPHLLNCRQLKSSDETTFSVTTKTNPTFDMSTHDPGQDGVSKMIHKDGCWECDHIQKMLDALSSHPDSYFLDIGGNIGMWTLTAAAAKKDTFTIEPSSENFQKICLTVNRNSFHDQIHLMTIAATSTPQTFRLNVPKANKGNTHVVPVNANDAAKDDKNRIIKGYPIDLLKLPLNCPVVMKVDVEGHELEALLGALEYMKEANVVFAMIELRTQNLKANKGEWSKIFNIFSSKGLVPFRIDHTKEVRWVETELDPKKLDQWSHVKYPKVQYFDVMWRQKTE